jgi:hypothetical protein
MHRSIVSFATLPSENQGFYCPACYILLCSQIPHPFPLIRGHILKCTACPANPFHAECATNRKWINHCPFCDPDCNFYTIKKWKGPETPQEVIHVVDSDVVTADITCSTPVGMSKTNFALSDENSHAKSDSSLVGVESFAQHPNYIMPVNESSRGGHAGNYLTSTVFTDKFALIGDPNVCSKLENAPEPSQASQSFAEGPAILLQQCDKDVKHEFFAPPPRPDLKATSARFGIAEPEMKKTRAFVSQV